MQFPVPQFTDVEDKIIAGLTFKQFAIVFGAAVFTFIIYTISKNLPITIGVAVLTGVPALALVFGKLNGRPLYSSAGNFIQYLFGPKIYIYHKEGKDFGSEYTPIVTEEKAAPKDLKATAVKIKELNYVLQQQQSEQSKLIDIIKKNREQSK
ncbi:MAG TPA: PrgI family protein [Candidatus Doudnabacteria bacterium]|nr:PrgI family protein [Candidatus Doudnabacteria bacterium]